MGRAEADCLKNSSCKLSIYRPAVSSVTQHLNNSQKNLPYFPSLDQSVEHLKSPTVSQN